MPNKHDKVEKDSEFSSSQSDNEEKPRTKGDGRKSREEKRKIRRPAQKKRLSGSLGATSGNVVQTDHSSKMDYTESPTKRTRRDRASLVRANAFDESGCGEGSNPELNCIGNLELKDESVENELQPPDVPERVASAAESPKMSYLAVPVHSSGVLPVDSEGPSTSPKEKGFYDRAKNVVENFFKSMSPKKSGKKGISSEKADIKVKQKSLKAKPTNLIPAKSEASSSSSSPISKKGDSSPDRSLPSTSSSDPNVEHPGAAKKSVHKFKTRAETSSASTRDVPRRRVDTLNVTSGRKSSRSPNRRSRSRSPRPECDCERKSDYEEHTSGCAYRAWMQRNINNRSCRNSFDPANPFYSSSGTASDSNVESSPVTKSPNKSRKTEPPRVSTLDPSQPGPSRVLNVPSPDNSPTLSGEAARSPNRRSPSRSPSTSQRSPRRASMSQMTQLKCTCSRPKKEGEPHEARCPFCRSPSRKR